MEEREEVRDGAGQDTRLGRGRFLAGGVFGALAALLGRAPDVRADTGPTDTGSPIIGGTVNPETDTTTLVVQTPNTRAFEVDAVGPALSAASSGDTAVVASSFVASTGLIHPPPHVPRAAFSGVSDAVGVIAAGGVRDASALTVTADARVGVIAAGGLDGLVSVTLTADASVGMIAAGGLSGLANVTSTAFDSRVGLIAAGGLTGGIGVTETAIPYRAGVIGVGSDAIATTVTVTAGLFGVGGFVPDEGLGVAGAAGGAALGGPPDVSVGVSGNAAGDGAAVSGNLFGATGTSPLASAALGIGSGVTVVALPDGTVRSPDSPTGGVFLGDIGILAASFPRIGPTGPPGIPYGPPPTERTVGVTDTGGVFLGDIGILAASFARIGPTGPPGIPYGPPPVERTAVVGVTDTGTAAHFEALGDGTGIEVVGPSVFDGPVTFTVGGHATIPKGKKSVAVKNPNIRAQDLVIVTLNGQPGFELSLQYVVCHDGSFTLWLTNYAGRATPFSWVAFRIG